jgi:hypothetical protein
MTWGITHDSVGGNPTGAVWLDLGRLRLIRCAPQHPNRWMIVWRRRLPEWNPNTKWQGSDTPGPFWKGCVGLVGHKMAETRGVAFRSAIAGATCRKSGEASGINAAKHGSVAALKAQLTPKSGSGSYAKVTAAASPRSSEDVAKVEKANGA